MLKKMMIVVLLMFQVLNVTTVHAQEEKPDIVGEYGVAIDANTKNILYDKNAKEKAYPASMTKVITAMVLDEKMEDGAMLTASENAATQECSCFGLTPGEKISKEDAIYALLLVSANDVAVMIAENVAGSVKNFSKLMNEKAKEIGANDTHFVTPNGLHDPEHYTTSYDMALIAREAMNHPTVLKAMGTQDKEVKVYLKQTDEKGKEKEVVTEKNAHNHGKFFKQKYVIGGKTGFTSAAGNTLVEILQKGDKKVVSVVMKSRPNQTYHDIAEMADYAFPQMKTKKVLTKGEKVGEIKVSDQKITVKAPQDVVVSYTKGEEKSVKTNVTPLYHSLSEVKMNQKIATLHVSVDGKEINTFSLVSDRTIKAEKPKEEFMWKNVLMGVAIPIPFYIFYLIRQNRMKKKESLMRKKNS